MIGVSSKPSLVERRADRADAAVHHVARRDHVGAGARLRDRGARQQLERRVVVDVAVVAQDAAVAVVGVLAQAHVGHHEQVGVGLLDRARGELDDALVVPGARALGVLRGRDPEQQHGRDAQRPPPRRPPRRRARSTAGRCPASTRSARAARRRGRRTSGRPADARRARSRAPARAGRRSCAGAAGCGRPSRGYRRPSGHSPQDTGGGPRCRPVSWAPAPSRTPAAVALSRDQAKRRTARATSSSSISRTRNASGSSEFLRRTRKARCDAEGA